jgi:hypothetical protein
MDHVKKIPGKYFGDTDIVIEESFISGKSTIEGND